MRIIEKEVKQSDLKNCEKILEEEMVKAVVDTEKGIMAIDGEMHADLEQLLLEKGSKQDNLWGINLWFNESGEDFLEFDSMINIRPRQGNRSRSVENPETQKRIREIVEKWIK